LAVWLSLQDPEVVVDAVMINALETGEVGNDGIYPN
jgi:hypothetical protein